MDSTFPIKAIILNRRNWREADRLVSVYTLEYGRLQLLARGACKLNSKLAAHLEPLSLSRLLLVKGKGFDYVGGALMEEAFLGIKSDLNKLYFAGQALSLFTLLVRENLPDKELFTWLEKWLRNLDEAGGEESLKKEDGRFRLALFSWRLFALLGYQARLDACVVCGKSIVSGKNYFDLAKGGIICQNCQSFTANDLNSGSIISLSDNCIKLLRLASADDWKNIKFSPRLLKEWESLNMQISHWISS